METSLKPGFPQTFSYCPKNLTCPKLGGAAALLALPARTPMSIEGNQSVSVKLRTSNIVRRFD